MHFRSLLVAGLFVSSFAFADVPPRKADTGKVKVKDDVGADTSANFFGGKLCGPGEKEITRDTKRYEKCSAAPCPPNAMLDCRVVVAHCATSDKPPQSKLYSSPEECLPKPTQSAPKATSK